MKGALLLLLVCCVAHAGGREFFAMDNGVGRGTWTPAQQAETLKELGYDGISYNYTTPADLAVWQRTFNERGLKIYGLYVVTCVGGGVSSYDPAFKDAIRMLKGTETIIWLAVRRKDGKAGTDAEAVSIIREISDQAASNSVRVAIYGHAGFYCASASDAVRLAKLADRPNVSATVNLCHEFMSGNGDRLDDTLKVAAPVSVLASINGVDVAGKRYILRLDQGDFDIAAYLKKLSAAGYKGPVGLQCFSVKGDVRENLKSSINAWRKLSAEPSDDGRTTPDSQR